LVSKGLDWGLRGEGSDLLGFLLDICLSIRHECASAGRADGAGIAPFPGDLTPHP